MKFNFELLLIHISFLDHNKKSIKNDRIRNISRRKDHFRILGVERTWTGCKAPAVVPGFLVPRGAI